MSNNISVATQKMQVKKADDGNFYKFQKWIEKNWQLTAMIFLPFCFIVLFNYIPMYGIQIAFKDYKAAQGIWGSEWVGFKHFTKFFNSYLFVRVVRNTILLNIYSLAAGFPIPIILALSLNSCKNLKFKKTVQMVTYAPHFISVVVLIGMVIQVLSESNRCLLMFFWLLYAISSHCALHHIIWNIQFPIRGLQLYRLL